MIPFDVILDRVSTLVDDMKLAGLHPQIAACRKPIAGNRSIDVAVLGRFKAGKSSFLNHLIGRNILPIGVVPLTAVITRVRYSPEVKVEVNFLNGATESINLDEIALYVGEDKNPDNRKQVTSVIVGLPELKPLAPLEFVDTPGLDSVFARNTETTLQWLPNTGAALVAISCDAPLSERDLEFIRELHLHTPRITLLLTKADLLTPMERAEVMSFVSKQLHAGGEAELPVFLYSIKPDCADMKTALEQGFLLPLIQHQDEAANQIVRHKTHSLLVQTLNYLRVALAVATQTEAARTALRDLLAGERRQFDLFREELQVMSREWSSKALEQSLTRLKPRQIALQDQIKRELLAQFPQWRVSLPRFLQAWREMLRSFLTVELTDISRLQKPMFNEPLYRMERHLVRMLTAFQIRLAEHVRVALGIELSSHEFNLNVREPAVPPVNVGHVDSAFSTISPLIPMSLFRRVIERSLLRKSRWEVEKNFSRLAALWANRVSAGIADLARQAEIQASDQLTALEQMLEQTASNAPSLKQTIAELEQYQIRLRRE